jgi:hypothetical protein
MKLWWISGGSDSDEKLSMIIFSMQCQLQRFQQFLTEHLQPKRKHPQPKMRHWLETPVLILFDTLVL